MIVDTTLIPRGPAIPRPEGMLTPAGPIGDLDELDTTIDAVVLVNRQPGTALNPHITAASQLAVSAFSGGGTGFNSQANAFSAAQMDVRVGTKFAGLVDNFAGLTLDAQFEVLFGASGISVGGNQLTIPCISTYTAVITTDQWDLTNSAIYAQVIPPANGNGSKETAFWLSQTQSVTQPTSVLFSIGSTEYGFTVPTLRAQAYNGTTWSQGPTVAWGSTTTPWLRFREAAGTIYWEYSADSKSWTPLWSTTDPIVLTKLYAIFDTGYDATETASNMVVSSVNVGANLNPVNTTAPAISGIAQVGDVLTVSNGTWSNGPITQYTYIWNKFSGGVGSFIGTNSDQYTLQPGDAGTTVYCFVYAENSQGTTTARSNSVGPIGSSGGGGIKFATFTDNFIGPTLDAAWTLLSGVAGTIVTANTLELPTIDTYTTIASVGHYDLTSSSFAFEFVPPPLGDGASETSILLAVSQATSGTEAVIFNIGANSFGFSQTTIQATWYDGSVYHVIGSVAWNATSTKWLRFREAAGTAYWDYSANGSTWTSIGSTSYTIPLISLYAVLTSGQDNLSFPTVVVTSGIAQIKVNGNRVYSSGQSVWGIPDHVASSPTVGSVPFATYMHTNRAAAASLIKAWGGNEMRLRILASDMLQGTGGSWAGAISYTTAITWVADYAAACAAVGIRLRITDWDPLDGPFAGGAWAGQANRSSGPFEVFQDIMTALPPASNPHVVYAPFNEPNGITWAQWQTNFQNTWTMFRGAGYYAYLCAHPIGYANSGTSGWGYDGTNYNTFETFDAGLAGMGGIHNTGWGKHDYNEGIGDFTAAAWVTAIGSQTLHLIDEDELGNSNTGVEPVSATWSVAATTQFAFPNMPKTHLNVAGVDYFNGFDWSDPNATTASDNVTPTVPWGNDIKSSAAQTPLPAFATFAKINVLPAGGQPVNSVAPVISGGTTQGNTLTVTSNGTWSNSPTSYTYQWVNGSTGPISGATAQTYNTTSSDLADEITCQVTAINSIGPSALPASSNTIGPIVPSGVGTTNPSGFDIPVSFGSTWTSPQTGNQYECFLLEDWLTPVAVGSFPQASLPGISYSSKYAAWNTNGEGADSAGRGASGDVVATITSQWYSPYSVSIGAGNSGSGASLVDVPASVMDVYQHQQTYNGVPNTPIGCRLVPNWKLPSGAPYNDSGNNGQSTIVVMFALRVLNYGNTSSYGFKCVPLLYSIGATPYEEVDLLECDYGGSYQGTFSSTAFHNTDGAQLVNYWVNVAGTPTSVLPGYYPPSYGSNIPHLQSDWDLGTWHMYTFEVVVGEGMWWYLDQLTDALFSIGDGSFNGPGQLNGKSTGLAQNGSAGNPLWSEWGSTVQGQPMSVPGAQKPMMFYWQIETSTLETTGGNSGVDNMPGLFSNNQWAHVQCDWIALLSPTAGVALRRKDAMRSRPKFALQNGVYVPLKKQLILPTK